MHLRSLLRLGERSKDSESENDREPDPHGHLDWEGWRESSRPELLAMREWSSQWSTTRP
jgi:hypothetical protein